MISETYISHTLQNYLKKAIYNEYPQYSYVLRMLLHCGAKMIPTLDGGGVHLISNGQDSRLIGVRMCNHSWVCPVCAARSMRQYSARISCAIEALNEQNLVPIMITFTIFHTQQNSLAEVMEILKKAHLLFSKSANWKRKKADGTCYESNGAWNNFVKEFNIRHSVKAFEVTYGKHGWHPHLHCLFWVPKNRLSEITNWEEKLLEQWRKKELAAAKAILSEEKFKIREFLYEKSDREYVGEFGRFNGLYISKDENGKAEAMTASSYICGWGADSELSGTQYKHSHKDGHYQIPELLENAYKHNDKKCLELYLQFAAYVISNRVHRIDFSRTGINNIIRIYQQTQRYKDFLKKKHIVEKQIPYHTVCWFPNKLWKQIIYQNDCSDWELVPLLLRFATFDNGFDLICELLHVAGLDYPCAYNPRLDVAELYNRPRDDEDVIVRLRLEELALGVMTA